MMGLNIRARSSIHWSTRQRRWTTSAREPCLGTNFVSNGSRGATADVLTDGASVTNSEPNGGITSVTYLPSPEAVEEFKVQQTNFSAEYGFSGASVVNVITRSGTNR